MVFHSFKLANIQPGKLKKNTTIKKNKRIIGLDWNKLTNSMDNDYDKHLATNHAHWFSCYYYYHPTRIK